MNIRSREIALGLALVGLLSPAACTAEKVEMKTPDIASAPVTPKLVDGVFTSRDELKPVYFGLNQSKLTEQQMNVVKENVEWLKSQPPFLVRIIGFTDSRGSMKRNERLALLRAKTVYDLYTTLGIPKERMTFINRQEASCTTMTEECLMNGRRSETLIEDKSLASR